MSETKIHTRQPEIDSYTTNQQERKHELQFFLKLIAMTIYTQFTSPVTVFANKKKDKTNKDVTNRHAHVFL